LRTPHEALGAPRWRELMRLAHVDKREAFRRYAAFYLASDGQRYASDDLQFGVYPVGYHAELDRELGHRGSEMIGELYVPRDCLVEFMLAAATLFRRREADVVYGTVRLIRADTETLLPWARRAYACIVFNLHVQHDATGIAGARMTFQQLIDIALEYDGGYYLTYADCARADQLRRCYPRLEEFMRLKRRVDPQGVFSSDWYRGIVAKLGVA
jgi:hypothetical protein